MTADDIRTLTDHTVNGIITANHENSALMRAEVAKVKMLGVIAEQLAIGNALRQIRAGAIPVDTAHALGLGDHATEAAPAPADNPTILQEESATALRRHDAPGTKKKGGR